MFVQVSLPADMTRRWGHSAVAFGTGPDMRVIVIFGGINEHRAYISETTLLLLCE